MFLSNSSNLQSAPPQTLPLRGGEGEQLRQSARAQLLKRLDETRSLPEHIRLALEAAIYELTDKAPKADYLAEVLVLFLPEEKVVFCQVLGQLLSDAEIKVGYLRGEISLERFCERSKLRSQVRITAGGRVLMHSYFTDMDPNSDALRAEANNCCSLIDTLSFLNICAHIWSVLS